MIALTSRPIAGIGGLIPRSVLRQIGAQIECDQDPECIEPPQRESSGKGPFDFIGGFFEDVGEAVQEGLDSAGDVLHDIERANRDALQMLAPCAIAAGVVYFTGGTGTAVATGICVPTVAGMITGQGELMPLDSPAAQAYLATDPDLGTTSYFAGDVTIPGLGPVKKTTALFGALAIAAVIYARSKR